MARFTIQKGLALLLSINTSGGAFESDTVDYRSHNNIEQRNNKKLSTQA